MSYEGINYLQPSGERKTKATRRRTVSLSAYESYTSWATNRIDNLIWRIDRLQEHVQTLTRRIECQDQGSMIAEHPAIAQWLLSRVIEESEK